MTKVLFLGANSAQLPYLEAARALDFIVIATDRNPDAPGAALAERFHLASYTDAEALLRIARAEGLGPGDRLFTAATHLAYEGASRVAQELGVRFPLPEDVDTCLDKTRFYAALGQLGVPVPPTWTWLAGAPPPLDPAKVYYLKSDYGKSPTYCYRVERGEIPPLPPRFDAFYREAFLLQEEVLGSHYRLNLYGDEAAVFARIGDRSWLPLAVLGPGHAGLVAKLRNVVAALGLERLLTKFDLIVNERGAFVIDIGLDRPLRMLLLARHLGLEFEALYTRAYLREDPAELPAWRELLCPVVLSLDAKTGHRVIPLEEEA